MRPKLFVLCAAGMLLASFDRCAVAQSGDSPAPLISSGHPSNASTAPSSGVRRSLSDDEPVSVPADEPPPPREQPIAARGEAGLSDQSWTASPAQQPGSATQSSRSVKPVGNSASPGGDAPRQQRANWTAAPLQPVPQSAAPLQPVPPQPRPSQSDAARVRTAPGAVQPAAGVYPSSGAAHLRSAVAPAQFTSAGVNSAEPSRDNDSDSKKAAGDAHRPLKPPTATDSEPDEKRSTGTVQMFVSVISSLLIVVGLLLGAAWCYRKATPNLNGSLPKQALQVLGRTPLAPRQQLILVRFGSKLVLMSNLQGEVRTISEIVDPLEVDRIAGMCESSQPGSISDSFRTVLHNIGRTG